MFVCFFIVSIVQLCIKDIGSDEKCPDGYSEFYSIKDIYENMEYYFTKIVILSKNLSIDADNSIDLTLLNFAFMDIHGNNQIVPFKFKTGQVKSTKILYLTNMIVEPIDQTASVRFDSILMSNVSFNIKNPHTLAFAAYRVECSLLCLYPFKSISATDYYFDILEGDDATAIDDYKSIFITDKKSGTAFTRRMNFITSNVSMSLLDSYIEIIINQKYKYKVYSSECDQKYNFHNSFINLTQYDKGESDITLNFVMLMSYSSFYSASIDDISKYKYDVQSFNSFMGLYGNYFNMDLFLDGKCELETSSNKVTLLSYTNKNTYLTLNTLSQYLMLYADDVKFENITGFNMLETISVYITALKLTISNCINWEIPPNIQMYAKVSLILDSSSGNLEQIEMNSDTELVVKMKNFSDYKMSVDSNTFQKFSQVVNFEYTGSLSDDLVTPYLFKRQDFLCGTDLQCDDWISSFTTSNSLITNYSNVREFCTPYLNEDLERCYSIEFIGLTSDVDAEFCYANEYESCEAYSYYINKDNFTLIKDHISDFTLSVRLNFADSLPPEYELNFDDFPLHKIIGITSLNKVVTKSVTIHVTNETKYHVSSLLLEYITVRFINDNIFGIGIPNINISKNVILDNNFEYINLNGTNVITEASHLPEVANSHADTVLVLANGIKGIRCDGSNQFVLVSDGNDIEFIWDGNALIDFEFPSSITNFEITRNGGEFDIFSLFSFVFNADSVKLHLKTQFSEDSFIGTVTCNNLIIETQSTIIPFSITSQSVVFDSSKEISIYNTSLIGLHGYEIQLSSSKVITYYNTDILTLSNIITSSKDNFILDGFTIINLIEIMLNSFTLRGNAEMMLGTQLTIEDCDIQDLNLTIHTDICSYPSILSIPSLFHYQIPVPQGLFIDPYCNNETYLISRKNISQKIISLPNEDVSNALINLVGLSTTYLEIDNTNIYNFSLHVNGSDIYLSAEKRIDYEEHDKRDISQLSFIFMIISVCICSITIIVLLVFIFMKIKKLRKKDAPQELLSYYSNDVLQFIR